MSSALERTARADLLCPVRRSWLEAGWMAGLIAAAATSGALVGFGIRFGTPLRAFNTIAAALLSHMPGGSIAAPLAVTITGVLLHVLASVCWGIAYAYVVERSGGHRLLWGVVVALAVFLVTGALASLSGEGLATLLPVGDRIAVAIVFAAALPLGMRLANPAIRQR